MENENQNTITPQAGSQPGNLQAYMSEMRRKRNRNILIGMLVAIFLGVIGYFAYKNPQLFKAEITERSAIPAEGYFYIPSYEGGAGEDGTIAVKVRQNTVIDFDSITFSLTYNPVNALTFGADPIVFDSDTKFQSAVFKMATVPQAGKLAVTIILPSPVTADAGATLFKLSTKIGSNAAAGTIINLGVQDFAVLKGVATQSLGNMVAGTITVKSLDQLKVLNAEATDSTHAVVRFSDFLQNSGNNNYYKIYINNNGSFGAALDVTNAELGSDQKSVNLTTAVQTAGISYIVVVTGDVITGNTQGKLNTDNDAALFYGYGQGTSALSNFGMVSAAATDYKTVVVTFTDDVETGSVSAADFTITNATVMVLVTNATASGKVVTLTVNGLLLKNNTYLLKTLTNSSVLRDSDGASMGINTVAFNGKDNGPILQGATITSSGGATPEYTLQLAFAPSTDTIAYGGISGNPIGHLYVDEVTTGGILINDDSGYNKAISANTITLKNPIFGDPTKLFTFTISSNGWIRNTLGMPADESFKTISFWGYGHVESNTIGNITVKNKNTIQVAAGTLPFSGITSNDQISVVYENPSESDLQTQAVLSFNVDGSGNLNIVFTNRLEPNRSYALRLKQGANIVVSKRFYLDQALSVTSATATAQNKIRVGFSEGIDENTVQTADFTVKTIDGTPVALSSTVGIQIESDYQHVVLTTDAALNPAAVYYVNAASDSTDPIEPIYAYSGKALANSIAAFGGYGTLASQSTVKTQSVDNISSNTLRLNFTSSVDQTTVTPVNVNIVSADAFICPSVTVMSGATCTPASVTPLTVNYVSGTNFCTCPDADPDIWVCTETAATCANNLALSNLTITNAVQVDADTYEFTTSKQTAGTNYFVIMNGVKDSSGLLLGNAKVLNFFGFELPQPVITNVSPAVVTNEVDQTITLTGQNLDIVQTVKVGNQTVTVTDKSATAIVFTLPSGFTAGSHAITFVDSESNLKTFPNSLLVTAPVTPMQIISEQSKAIPYNVPPDGETKTMLWALVQDPVGLANISSVVVNLSQIGGPVTQAMAKDTGTQPQYGQWYKYEVTVPATVATKSDPYLLPVEARKGSDVVTGTVSIHVTGDVYQSVAPTINQAYVSPVSVPPDGKTPIKISAQVTDMDGADTITSVVADLGTLGVGFVNLSAIETGSGAELTTKFYQSEEFTVATTTAVGTYTINVTASDSTGESVTKPLTLNVSTQLTGPSINAEKSYVSPRKSIPNDEKTAFALNVYVTDPDGISDVTNVIASFGSMGLAPVTLIKDPNAPETSKSAFFSAGNLTIPKTSPLGVQSIEITAEDTTGGLANYVIQIDVTAKDLLGDAPMIIQDKGYTTPKVAINDGATPITLYVFVRDDDDNLESVVANLSQIGQVGPETPAGLKEAGTSGTVQESGGGAACPTGSNVMVCMNPSVKEGTAGQWFILPGVTVSKNTMPSSEPYIVDIMVSDATGRVAHGQLPVSVNNGESFTNDKLPPKIVAAVPTGINKVEILFSEEISANSVSPSGAEFTITDKDDISQKLGVVSATINAVGTIVTLTTDTQVAGRQYVLTATSGIRDAVGIPLVAGASNRMFFNGFQTKGKVPVVDYVTATGVDTVEVEFQDVIKPSSIKLGAVTGAQAIISGGDVNFEIFEVDTSNRLPVIGVSFGDKPNVIVVKTDPQKPNQGYRMQVRGVESYDGKKSDSGASKAFKGLNLRTVQRQAAGNIGDFDGNGKVDFSDFTIFSSVYGLSYYQNGGAETPPAEAAPETGGQPITPTPDATVSATSEPAGGEIPATSEPAGGETTPAE